MSNIQTHDVLRTITEKLIEVAQIADQNEGAALRCAKVEAENFALKVKNAEQENTILALQMAPARATNKRKSK